MSKMFRDLSANEEQSFRAWARENYIPLSPILGVWHPVVQEECAQINAGAPAPFSEVPDVS